MQVSKSSIYDAQKYIAALNSGNTDELMLYMVGPGGNEKFQFGSNAAPEYLAASTLDSWLDSLQSRISGRVIVIYDAPQSGTFLAELRPPAGKQRIVITGASPGERSWFLDDGEISFSYRLFARLSDNAELFDAFDDAKDDVELLQTPRIDANGDGTPDARGKSRNNDTYVVGRGRFVDTDPPTIGTLNADPPQLYSGNTTSTLAAGSVDADTGLSRVWARVIPPIETMLSPNDPGLVVPTFKLLDINGDGVYDHEYSEFKQEGDYRVFAYAIDLMGFQSFPKLVEVRQNNGEPLAKKGDVDLDGEVTLLDAILVLKFTCGVDSAYPAVAGDATEDERIDLADAVYILKKVSND